MKSLVSTRSKQWSIGILVLFVGAAIVVRSRLTTAEPVVGHSAQALTPNELSLAFRDAAAKVSSCVVTVETWNGPRKTRAWRALERSATGAPEIVPADAAPPESGDGSATGIILHRRGLILTAGHVIADAETVVVRLRDGRTFIAQEVAADPDTDIAVVHISPGEDLPDARLGDSDDLRVGDWVVGVGNPYGLTASASAGIISAVDRRVPEFGSALLLQTDAATNPGSSGGAIANLRGEVVGVNVGSVGYHRGFEGIGFAVPINEAVWIAKELVAHGHVRRTYLGCEWEPLTADVAKLLGLKPPHSGALVCGVIPGSPAAEAGLQAGDLIVAVDNESVEGTTQLQKIVSRTTAGSRYEMKVRRRNEMLTVNIEVASREQVEAEFVTDHPLGMTAPPPAPENVVLGGSEYSDDELGLQLADLPPGQAAELELRFKGPAVLITEVALGGIAYHRGLCAGMAVVQVGQTPVGNVEEFRAAMRLHSLEQDILLLVRSPGGNHFLVLQRPPRVGGLKGAGGQPRR